MRPPGLLMSWRLGVLALFIVAAATSFYLVRERVRGKSTSQEPHARPAEEGGPLSKKPGEEKRLFRCHPAAGQVMTYRLKGNLDARCLWRGGETPTPLHVRLEAVVGSIALNVLERWDDSVLLSVSLLSIGGQARTGEGAGSTEKPLQIADLAAKASGWMNSAILRVSLSGAVLEIYVDPRIRSSKWKEAGCLEYLRTTLMLYLMFPSLVPSDAEPALLEGQVLLFDLIGMEFAFSPRTGGQDDVVLEGSPTKMTRFFGFPIENASPFSPADSARIGRSSISFSRKLAFYRAVRHHVSLDSGDDFTAAEVSLDYAGSHSMDSAPFDPAMLESMERLASIEEFKSLLARLDRKGPGGSESTAAGSGEVDRLVDLLDKSLAHETGSEELSSDELQDQLARLLADNPKLVDQLKSVLQLRMPSDGTLVKLLQILGHPRLKNLADVDQLALFLVGTISHEADTFNALISLQSFKRSDRVLDYLMTLTARSKAIEDARSSSLASLLENSLREDDLVRAARIVDSMVPDLEKGGSSHAALLTAVCTPNDALDGLVEKKWNSGLDRRAALKLLLLRSQGSAGRAESFRDVVRANVFSTFADDQIVHELIPLAMASRNEGFLQFLHDKSTSDSVKSSAASSLDLVRARPR